MRVLFLNQYFPPDVAATGQLLGQLTEDLRADFDVSVVCGTPTYDPDPAGATTLPPDSIRRVPLLPFSRRHLPVRLANYVLFLFGAPFRALFAPRADLIVCWTDPPLTPLVGAFVKAVRGGRFVVVFQDVYPEAAVAAGKMNGPVSRCLFGLVRRIVRRRADAVVAVGPEMKDLLVRKGFSAERVHVLPNWQDAERLTPRDKTGFRARENIPGDAFVVMHSGNIGVSQDLDRLLAVAVHLREDPGILFVIAGGGAALDALERRAGELRLENVRFLPYQPAVFLAESLSSADLHYVSLRPEFLGAVVPSKIYGILAVARPVLAVVPENCEVARIVRETGCGFLAGPDTKALADRIRAAARTPEELERMGKAGRAWVEEHGSRKRATAEYVRLFREVVKS